MSAPHRNPSPASAASNQFIRPNMPSTRVDTASAAERLALKGAGFATSDEVAAAIREGVAAELADAVMAALGSRFEGLSDEDVRILADLYTAAPSAAMATADAVEEPDGPTALAEQAHDPPRLPEGAGGDVAAGSPATSVLAVPEEKDALSSPEDDSSSDESPCGEGTAVLVELPFADSLPKWRMFGHHVKTERGNGRRLASLARRLTGMSLGQEPEVPDVGPVNIPGSLIATLARNPPKRIPGARAVRPTKQVDDDESGEESDRPPSPRETAPPPGGGDGDPPHDSDDDDEEAKSEEDKSSSDSEMGEAGEEEAEDPDNAGKGKFYKPQTPRGKAMAKMFRRFCDLPKRDANAIVVYFGVYSAVRLAAFHQDHWKDTFTQWQKRHPNRDGSERAMVLPPPQQDRIRCAAWACRHFLRLRWPARYFNICWLRPQLFEAIRAQMEREEEGKVTVKMIPDLTDIPKWKDRGSTSMSKHFRDFETYLSQHYGVEGFPLDWVVRPSLRPLFWADLNTPQAEQQGLRPDFFKFEETDHRCRVHAPIVPFDEAHHLCCSDDKVVAEWESGLRSNRRSDVFRRDDAIVFQLARIAFADSPGEVHFIPRKGKVQQSGRQSYFACKGQFVGINTARLECDLARDVIQKMRYEGESRNWNWDRHCTKFHQQIRVIDEWAVAGLATPMSAEDQISAFLKTIPKDCKNGELLIAKGIIEGDRSRFPTLVGNVIPHLTLSIDTKEYGAQAAKRTIANTSSASGRTSEKRRRTGRGSGRSSRGQTAGNCRVVGDKVVGTIEGLHYREDIWKAMSKSQKERVVELRKAKSAGRAVKATATTTAGTVPTDVSDQLQTLTRAVQSLDSSRDDGRRSADRHSTSRRRDENSRSRSSSHSHGTHRSGAHAGRRTR